jgi:predicted anti-sigma-YlaC factor YlaD
MSRDACVRAREMIVDAMLRRLPPLKNPALSEHLGECPPCRAEFIEMRNELNLLTQPRAPGAGWGRRA